MAKLRTGRMLGRSRWGNFIMFSLLILCGAFMVLPIVYSILQSFKPLNEINLFLQLPMLHLLMINLLPM